MELKFEGFTRILSDNDMQYFTLLKAAVDSVDSYSYICVTKTPTAYNFKISPSETKFINVMITELNKLHNFLGIELNYSKSSKRSGNISFNIPIFAETN